LDLDTELSGALDQSVHEIGVEAFEGPGTVREGDVRAGPRRDMSELEGNVATAYEQQTLWEFLELEKCGAGREVLASQDPELHGFGAGPDMYVARIQGLAVDLDGARADEVGAAVKHVDAGSGEALLSASGNGLREAALEAHELRPVDRRLRRPDPLSRETLHPVERFRGSHQHFLGIAAADGTGST
jgi:hypothetical protein